jgi:two-component system chemotaxis response regulator CheY
VAIVVDDYASMRHILFLMVTAEAQKENAVETVRVKVSNYVVKPFSPSMFTEKLVRIVPLDG